MPRVFAAFTGFWPTVRPPPCRPAAMLAAAQRLPCRSCLPAAGQKTGVGDRNAGDVSTFGVAKSPLFGMEKRNELSYPAPGPSSGSSPRPAARIRWRGARTTA